MIKTATTALTPTDVTTLRGRITEVWTETDSHRLFIELVHDSERTVIHTQNTNTPQSLNALKRGDIVCVQVTPENELITAEILGGPVHQTWDPLGDGLRWRRITSGPSRMTRLHQRQTIIQTIREDLNSTGFIEIETPLLVQGTCPDIEIESIHAGDGYLITSTEYQIKRMIVGGFEKVYTLTKNFRANDRSRYHSSEFTMLEWARAFETLNEIEEDTVRFVRKAFQKLYPGKTSLPYLGHEIDLMTQPWEGLTVREALRIHLGLENLGDFSLTPLLNATAQQGVHLPEEIKDDSHFILSYLLGLVQPKFGVKTPTFLREWPAFMTSSALISKKDPHVAERSELYIAGIEISDGFPFLRDAELQSKFFDRELQRRKTENRNQTRSDIRVDHRYIEALAQGIPPGAGMALGVDRLVMVLTGASNLTEVQSFGWDEI